MIASRYSYRWVMEEGGNLRLDRNPGYAGEPENLPQYDVVKGKLEPRSDQVDFPASYKEGSKDVPFNLEESERYTGLAEERDEWIDRRDQAIKEQKEAEAAGNEELANQKQNEAAKAGYQVNERSRKVAEEASSEYMQKTYGENAEVVYPDPSKQGLGEKSQSGDFDQVWKVKGEDGKDKFVVIESKGGTSTLGSRKTSTGRAEQGSSRYFEDVAKNMYFKGEDIGEELLNASKSGDVQYLKVQVPIDAKNGTSTARNAKISEFNLQK
ncbi:hypothetical protein [Gloeobacter kilaueensis]|nr:hypothetical protein [Gloeobacter kilaueensis]